MLPASTNPASKGNATTVAATGATDSAEPSKTSGDADVATAAAAAPVEGNSNTTTGAGGAGATAQNAPAPKISASPSPAQGQVSNGNNDSKVTSAGTGGSAPTAQGSSVLPPKPATTPASPVVSQPTVAAPNSNTTAGAIVVPQTPAPTAAGTWSILSGLLPTRQTSVPITAAPALAVSNQAQLPSRAIYVVAQPVTTGGSQSQQSPQGATTANNTTGKKRRPAPVLNVMRRKRIRPTIIDDKVALAILGELRLTREFLGSGRILAWALSPNDIEFSNIYDYVSRSQDHGYGVKVLSIVRIIPGPNQSDGKVPVDFSQDPTVAGKQRKMLWYGAKKWAITDIVERGMRFPQKKGIFLADRVSQACEYCDNTRPNIPKPPTQIGYLFLCDVLMGEMNTSLNNIQLTVRNLRKHGDRYVGCSQTTGLKFNSAKVCGTNEPDEQWDTTIDGCVWPLGNTMKSKTAPITITAWMFGEVQNFNEYTVFDPDQIQPKFLVKVEIGGKPSQENVY